MNESDIDRLLRQQTPEVPVPPGLETRVRASLRLAPRRRLPSFVWLLAPATVVAVVAMVMVLAPERPTPEVAGKVPDAGPGPEVTAAMPEADDASLLSNPLDDEARALRSGAERTGRFLLNSLPTLSAAQK